MDTWDHTAMIAHTVMIPWTKQRMKIEDFHPFRSARGDLAQIIEENRENAKPLPDTITEDEMEEKWSGIRRMIDGAR